ncbi:MAG: TetR/AcrR family transcriptional regulator [Gammaproteobacteria bacterium]|nr:TetR/AcrR family transcriptional regulator [Gammaproteobacteria bacterium]
MRKPDEELAQKRKKQILDAAIACFLKSGFHNTGMKEICTAANMSPGALYRYFDSKGSIIQAIAEREQQEMTGALQELRRASNLKRALLIFMEEFTREACRMPENILGTEIFAESTRNKEVAKILKKTEGDFQTGMKALLQDAEADGKIILKLSPDETARAILSLVYGFSTLALLDRKTASRKHAKLSRMILENLIR